MSAASPSTMRRAGPSTLTRARAAKGAGAGAGQAYRLSRIQAEGWNAAHHAVSTAPDVSDSAKIDSLNPYRTGPERTRWKIGFTSALAS